LSAPKIKGAAVREFLRWYAQRSSPEALREALAELPPGMRSLFDPTTEALGVLASSWYDTRTIAELVQVIIRTVPPMEREASVRDGARFAVKASARGIYRFVLERLSPEMYARNIQRLWNMLHDTGTREIVMTSEASATSYTRDWPGHDPFLCLATVHTMAAILEVMGCSHVHAKRVQCVADGASECVAELRWTPP
jgi:hypothetical protein